MSNFVELLKQNSLKVTTQRVSMLEIIEKYGHISVEKLHEILKKTHPSISLNTVYLNIEKLNQNGIINKISADFGKPKYEIKKQEHIHLICKECLSVIDKKLSNTTIENLKLNEDFEIEKISINIYGICSKCKMR